MIDSPAVTSSRLFLPLDGCFKQRHPQVDAYCNCMMSGQFGVLSEVVWKSNPDYMNDREIEAVE